METTPAIPNGADLPAVVNAGEPMQMLFHFTTATAMVIPPEYTMAQWAELAEDFNSVRLRLRNKAIHWYLGDWLMAGEARGQEYTQFMDRTGYDMGTCEQDLSVCKAYTDAQGKPIGRHENLTFSHHAIARFVEPERREYWLNKSEEERLTTAQLRREMTKAGDIRQRGNRKRGAAKGKKEKARKDERVGAQVDLSPERIGEILETLKSSVPLCARACEAFMIRCASSDECLQKGELPYENAEQLLSKANDLKNQLILLATDLDVLLSARTEAQPKPKRVRKKKAA